MPVLARWDDDADELQPVRGNRRWRYDESENESEEDAGQLGY